MDKALLLLAGGGFVENRPLEFQNLKATNVRRPAKFCNADLPSITNGRWLKPAP
jgi:hypothetical protein